MIRTHFILFVQYSRNEFNKSVYQDSLKLFNNNVINMWYPDQLVLQRKALSCVGNDVHRVIQNNYKWANSDIKWCGRELRVKFLGTERYFRIANITAKDKRAHCRVVVVHGRCSTYDRCVLHECMRYFNKTL